MSFLIIILASFVATTFSGQFATQDLCCDRSEKSGCRRERCCATTGEWVCPDNDDPSDTRSRPSYSSCDNFGRPCRREDTDIDTGSDTTTSNSNNCCNIEDRPPCIEPSACCPDGTWTCSIGDCCTFTCGEDTLILGQDTFGDICNDEETQCCDPALEPGTGDNPICSDGYICCPGTGEWSCGIGDGTFPCGDEILVRGQDSFGTSCDNGEEETQCCDPDLEPGNGDNPICTDGYVCCPTTGEWSCGIGDGTFPCGDEPTYITYFESGSACVTQCCDPRLEPGRGDNPICIEGHICCGVTGEWVCGDATGNEFECGDEIITREESSESCKCCDPRDEPGVNDNPLCFEGHFCCPLTGTWECSIGDAIRFPCGGEIFTRDNEGETCRRRRGNKGGKRG